MKFDKWLGIIEVVVVVAGVGIESKWLRILEVVVVFTKLVIDFIRRRR